LFQIFFGTELLLLIPSGNSIKKLKLAQRSKIMKYSFSIPRSKISGPLGT
jgi:hypothetical protein